VFVNQHEFLFLQVSDSLARAYSKTKAENGQQVHADIHFRVMDNLFTIYDRSNAKKIVEQKALLYIESIDFWSEDQMASSPSLLSLPKRFLATVNASTSSEDLVPTNEVGIKDTWVQKDSLKPFVEITEGAHSFNLSSAWANKVDCYQVAPYHYASKNKMISLHIVDKNSILFSFPAGNYYFIRKPK
jgi:hypothetical protein